MTITIINHVNINDNKRSKDNNKNKNNKNNDDNNIENNNNVNNNVMKSRFKLPLKKQFLCLD